MKTRLIAARRFITRKWSEFFGTKEFYALLETFFNEAAVLWFVFPLIDAIYKIKSSTDTQSPSIVRIVATSWSAAGAFFYLAVNAKRNAERSHKGEKSWETSPQ